jgi:hypothetical protein
LTPPEKTKQDTIMNAIMTIIMVPSFSAPDQQQHPVLEGKAMVWAIVLGLIGLTLSAFLLSHIAKWQEKSAVGPSPDILGGC